MLLLAVPSLLRALTHLMDRYYSNYPRLTFQALPIVLFCRCHAIRYAQSGFLHIVPSIVDALGQAEYNKKNGEEK